MVYTNYQISNNSFLFLLNYQQIRMSNNVMRIYNMVNVQSIQEGQLLLKIIATKSTVRFSGKFAVEFTFIQIKNKDQSKTPQLLLLLFVVDVLF